MSSSGDTRMNKEDKIPVFMEFVILWEACPPQTNELKFKRQVVTLGNSLQLHSWNGRRGIFSQNKGGFCSQKIELTGLIEQ